jgi:hypothetical protein
VIYQYYRYIASYSVVFATLLLNISLMVSVTMCHEVLTEFQYFGRKALKIKRVWDFTKVYRHKCWRQCVDFCLENALKLACMHL